MKNVSDNPFLYAEDEEDTVGREGHSAAVGRQRQPLRALRDSSIDFKSMNDVSDYRQALLSLEGNQDEQTKPYS